MKVKVNLKFSGQAEEAINFYKTVFDGKIENLVRYGETPAAEKIPQEFKDKLANARLDFGDNMFNVSDVIFGKVEKGNNVHIDTVFDKSENIEDIYKALSEGAEIVKPLAPNFFTSAYAELIDKFGIYWSVMYM